MNNYSDLQELDGGKNDQDAQIISAAGASIFEDA